MEEQREDVLLDILRGHSGLSEEAALFDRIPDDLDDRTFYYKTGQVDTFIHEMNAHFQREEELIARTDKLQGLAGPRGTLGSEAPEQGADLGVLQRGVHRRQRSSGGCDHPVRIGAGMLTRDCRRHTEDAQRQKPHAQSMSC